MKKKSKKKSEDKAVMGLMELSNKLIKNSWGLWPNAKQPQWNCDKCGRKLKFLEDCPNKKCVKAREELKKQIEADRLAQEQAELVRRAKPVTIGELEDALARLERDNGCGCNCC